MNLSPLWVGFLIAPFGDPAVGGQRYEGIIPKPSLGVAAPRPHPPLPVGRLLEDQGEGVCRPAPERSAFNRAAFSRV
jgi:hypothetical protein